MKPKNFETAFFVGQPLKVLLVEDSAADAELCLQALSQHGYRVQADMAATPDEFTQKLTTGTYDVILSDYYLPGWTGADVLNRLNSLGLRLPFILVTAKLEAERLADLIDQGADDYVLKDHLQRLPLAVRRVMREQRLFAEIRQAAEERERLVEKLQETLGEVRRLNGLLPVCMSCKRVLNTQGFWNRIESYIERYSDARVSPSLCPDCSANRHPKHNN